jgi:uncharacterized protein YjbI with pentapeptide repeats
MDKSQLEFVRNRWTRESSDAGMRFLCGKGSPPFPALENGLDDLRGLTITHFIKNLTITQIDLSGARTEGFGQFGMCSVSTCRFERSTLTTNLGSSFEGADFSSATLSGAVLRGRFNACNFTSANLTSVMGDQVQFVACIFTNANFRKAMLTHCLFEDCHFVNSTFGSGSFSFSKFCRSAIDTGVLGNTLMENVVSC